MRDNCLNQCLLRSPSRFDTLYCDNLADFVRYDTINRIIPFHEDFSPSGEQLEHRKLAYDL